MKFSCQSDQFQKALSIVDKAISNRSSVNVLEYVFLSLKENKLTLIGNDLEIGIKHSIPVDSMEQEGEILVKSKTILSIMGRLQNHPVTIETTENVLKIKSEKVDFEILGLSTNDYPQFPKVNDGYLFPIQIEELKDLIKKTIFSVSFDETKQFLNGILIKNEPEHLSFISTDGFRLSLKQKKCEGIDKEFSAIVPFKAMNEVSKIIQTLPQEESIEINVSEKQVAFFIGETTFLSRLIEGQFPDYRQVMPSESVHSYVIPRKLLLDASERAQIIAAESNNVVRFNFFDNELIIKSNANALGEFKEGIDVNRESGEGDSKIAFNVKLILDAIKNLDDEDLVIKFSSEVSPCVIQPKNEGDYTYIIMPIRTNDFQETDA
ncbi:DNA polymerase III subunit beta [bacterium]|jgi:DNA polymerase III subunit beta|nr:DNA polymerase III subunit beta [bacterium]